MKRKKQVCPQRQGQDAGAETMPRELGQNSAGKQAQQPRKACRNAQETFKVKTITAFWEQLWKSYQLPSRPPTPFFTTFKGHLFHLGVEKGASGVFALPWSST